MTSQTKPGEVVLKYHCPICDNGYAERGDAEECLTLPVDPEVSVGLVALSSEADPEDPIDFFYVSLGRNILRHAKPYMRFGSRHVNQFDFGSLTFFRKYQRFGFGDADENDSERLQRSYRKLPDDQLSSLVANLDENYAEGVGESPDECSGLIQLKRRLTRDRWAGRFYDDDEFKEFMKEFTFADLLTNRWEGWGNGQ